jgi:hypothetical protein
MMPIAWKVSSQLKLFQHFVPTSGHYGLNNQARWVRVGLTLVWWETTKHNCPLYPQEDPLCWPNMNGAIHKIEHPPTRLLWYLIIQPKWTNNNVMEQAHGLPIILNVACFALLGLEHLRLRASPQVISMWVQTVKYIVEKSKCASLSQEIDFLHQIRAACCDW